MIKSISEQNELRKFNLRDECIKIEDFLVMSVISYDYGYQRGTTSIEGYVANNFLDWHLRGTHTDIYTMRNFLGIDGGALRSDSASDFTAFNFFQYAYNLAYAVNEAFFRPDGKKLHPKGHNYYIYDSDESKIIAIGQNIRAVLRSYGMQMEFDEDKSEYYIAYTNHLADAVASSNPSIAQRLVEYRRIEYSNDLQRKSEILFTLYKEIFEVEKGKSKNKLPYITEAFEKDAGFMLGEVVRHNEKVMKNKSVANKLNSMSDEEKACFYDTAYDYFVAFAAMLPCIRAKEKVKELKSEESVRA